MARPSRKWKDFYVESVRPSASIEADKNLVGAAYFIEGLAVSHQDFMVRRERECYHRDGGNGVCVDCHKKLMLAKGKSRG
jgi:hypothetical protein